MRIAALEFFPASIPYKHREISTQVSRDGVTDVIVKATTDDGLVGWGESCSGADVTSVLAALEAMRPFVLGRSPWESEAIRSELWWRGLWQFRKPTASFAYAGIDIALWDICGKAAGQPLYNLFGGKVRDSINHFYYLDRGSSLAELGDQCRDGVEKGFSVFYIKVGLDIDEELKIVEIIRSTTGPQAKIRVDANGAWTVREAIRNLALLDRYKIDFVEQPVLPDPLENMIEVRSRSSVPVCANEGLWTAEDAYRHIKQRAVDVLCFSPYWVGSLALFQRLSYTAHFENLHICRHTHGEFGIASAAAQHVLLTLPNILDGNQQVAYMMEDDVLREPLPIASGPDWGVPQGSGLGVEIDEDKVVHYHELYQSHGQFLPYDPAQIGARTMNVRS
jgi:L-alanine-DL-glutamate epimerase-like enolase superfamily enzyme